MNSDATGSFPDYPEEEDGGSALIFAEKTPEEVNICSSLTNTYTVYRKGLVELHLFEMFFTHPIQYDYD